MSLMANYTVPSDLLQILDVKDAKGWMKYAEDVQSGTKAIKTTDFHNAIDLENITTHWKTWFLDSFSYEARFCDIWLAWS